MKSRHIPDIDARYWALLILASIFGANTGDFFADALGFGHVSGLPVLLGCFLLIMTVERADKSSRTIYFWLAIIVARTAATNIGDIGHDLHWSGLAVVGGLAALMVATLAGWREDGRERTDGTRASRFATHPLYWWTMLLAGALGTALGDYCSFGLHLGNLNAALALAVPVALLLYLMRDRQPLPLLAYWSTVVAIRAAATAAGDFFANHVFGLGVSTFVFGMAFVVATTAAYGARRDGSVQESIPLEIEDEPPRS